MEEKIYEVKHFLEYEIERTNRWLEDTLSPVFNGVEVGAKNAVKLKKKHIEFCEQILAILDKK